MSLIRNPKKDAISFELNGYDFEESGQEAAARLGMIMIEPKPNELFVDIDSEESYTEFHKRIEDLKRFFHMEYKEKISKSGLPHQHITVSLFHKTGEPYKVDPYLRILLQHVLGSDRVREILSTYRILSGVENPTRFFEAEHNL